jgi:hypothetical protein
VLAAVLGAGCGDDDGGASSQPTEQTIIITTTAPTTLPPRRLAADLAKRFGPNGTARKLLEFFAATEPVTTGDDPSPELCQDTIRAVAKVGSVDEMFGLADKIPDLPLKLAWRDDIASKRFLLGTCDEGRPVPAEALKVFKEKNDALEAEMAKHGFELT